MKKQMIMMWVISKWNYLAGKTLLKIRFHGPKSFTKYSSSVCGFLGQIQVNILFLGSRHQHKTKEI